MWTARTLALALAAASLPGVAAEAADRVIAHSGMAAPDQPPGTVVTALGPTSDQLLAPVVNRRGGILLFAQLSEPGGGPGLRSSALLLDGDVLSLVAAEDQQIPDLAGGDATVVAVDPRVLLDDGGRAALFALVDVPDEGLREGVWATDAAGDLRLVVREGQVLPQNDPVSPVFGWEFSDLTADDVYFGGGRTGFLATAADPADPFDTVAGIWSERPTVWPRELRVVARDGADTDFSGTSPSAVNGRGETVFRANVPGGQSIWSESGGVLAQVAQVGSDAGGDVTFSSFGEPDMNDNGNTAWRASFSDHPDGAANGLWKQMPLTAGVIVVEGIVAPGMPDVNGDGVPDYVFGSFANDRFRPLVNRDGHVAFLAQVRTPDFSDQLTGIWTDRNGGLDLLEAVALEGDHPPGLPPDAVFTTFDRYSLVINSHGEIAFKAGWERPGTTTAWGIWAERDGALELVASAVLSGADGGDLIQLPGGATFEAELLFFAGGSGNQDGRPSGFSDTGDVVYRAAEVGGAGLEAIVVDRWDLFTDGFESGDVTRWSAAVP